MKHDDRSTSIIETARATDATKDARIDSLWHARIRRRVLATGIVVMMPSLAFAAGVAEAGSGSESLLPAALVGATLLAIYSYGRFNNPSTCRSSTTLLRYYIGATMYVASILIVYSVCLTNPWANRVALDLIRNVIDVRPAALPLLLALVMTCTVDGITPLTALDELLRHYFQRLASIPSRARSLSADLRSNALVPTERVRASVVEELTTIGLDPEDVVFGAGSSAQQLLTRGALLLHRLRTWEESNTFGGFYGDHAREIQTLEYRHKELVEQFITTRRPADSIPADWTSLVKAHRSAFRAQVETLVETVSDLMSRGVLECGRTERARDRELESMGFAVSHQGLTMDQRVAVLLIISALMTLFIIASNQQLPLGRRIALGAAAALSNWVSVLWAIEPRERRWEIAQPDRPGYPPIKYYVMVALGTAVSAMLIRALFRVTQYGSLEDSLRQASEWAAWVLVDIATAIAIAVHTDDARRPWPRWAEAASQALVSMTVAAAICWWHLATVSTSMPQLIGRLGLFGFLLGWFVPTWYRGAPRDRLARACNPESAEPVVEQSDRRAA